jgi:hypothetical protein
MKTFLGTKFTPSLCKLDPFAAVRKAVSNNEVVKLTNRV